MMNYEDRRQALEIALESEDRKGSLRSTLATSVARIQALIVELDPKGEPVLPAPWVKWLCSTSLDFTDYNETRTDLTGDKLVRPEEIGTLLNPQHPAYDAVRADYARRGLRLNKSVRLYARLAGATPSSRGGADAGVVLWSDLVEHLVGAVNALPAAQRAIVTQRLQAS